MYKYLKDGDRFRWWSQTDEQYGQFTVLSREEFQRKLEAAKELGIPVREQM